MDLTSVTSYRVARSRADLALGEGEAVLGGGTFLYSEPHPHVTGLVDLTGLGWPPIEHTANGLRIAATCTIAELVAYAEGRGSLAPPPSWRAVPLFVDAANALLASFKIWNTATVGGNIAQSFAAGSMIALGAALDADVVIWTPGGGQRRTPVSEVPLSNARSSLDRGEVLRAVEIPRPALEARAVLHKTALADHGRSGAVVTGRLNVDGTAVFGLTAAVHRPVVFRWSSLPSADELAEAVAAAPGYYTDPLGARDWRCGVSVVLAERCRSDLAARSHS